MLNKYFKYTLLSLMFILNCYLWYAAINVIEGHEAAGMTGLWAAIMNVFFMCIIFKDQLKFTVGKK